MYTQFVMDQVYAELERRHDKALSRAIHILDNRYSTLKKVMAIFGVLLTLGTVAGLFAVRHEADQRVRATCWARYDNAAVLKGLVNKTGQKFDASIIKDPQLKQLILVSQNEGVKFKTFANKNVTLPRCSGRNPNPLTPEIKQLIHG